MKFEKFFLLTGVTYMKYVKNIGMLVFYLDDLVRLCCNK